MSNFKSMVRDTGAPYMLCFFCPICAFNLNFDITQM
uniref:Uncharacterized protein n=1 Tax=Anguilla anguilla TaxID=7936 RepID=A0A0E9RNT8_ANGAN